MWYIHKLKHHSATEKNKVQIHVTTQMNLENMLNKPVTKGHIIYDSIYLKCLEKVNSSEGRETGEGGKEHGCTYG